MRVITLRRTLQHPPAGERGQSTVEYVGLAVAVAVLLAAVGGGLGGHGDKIGGAVAKRLQEAISVTK